jgi:hypothetical protein
MKKNSKLEKELADRKATTIQQTRHKVESLDVLVGRREFNEVLLTAIVLIQVALTAWAVTGSSLYYPSQRTETVLFTFSPDVTRTVPYWKEIPVAGWVHNLCIVISSALLLWWILLLVDKRGWVRVLPTYRVKFLRWADRDEYPDLRADVNALQSLKHANPLYCWVTYSSLTTQGRTLISAELLAQLTATKYMDPLMDYDTAKFKIVNAVSTTQLVNLDRYAAFKGASIGLDTAVVALAMWRQFKDQFEEMGFGLRPC